MRNARTVSKTVGLTTVMVVVAMAAAGCTSDQPLDAETAAPTTAPVVTSIAASEATTSAPPATSASTSPPTSSTTSVAPTTAADTEPPPLVVTAPAGGATVTEAAVRFEGITEPGATVLAWDQWPATVAADGTWSIALILDPGTNVARFTAADAAGNVSIAEAVVRYEPPAPPTTTTTTTPPSPATVVITFHPAVVPDEHTEGSCSTHSFQAWRDDAYRCFTLESTIYDPCFDTGEHLICGADPITGNAGFVLDLTEPLPKEPPADDLHPWIIELADGMLCWGAGGATGNIDGRRLDWSCADGTWIVRGLEQAEIWTGQRVMMDLGGINVVTDYGFVPLGTVWL